MAKVSMMGVKGVIAFGFNYGKFAKFFYLTGSVFLAIYAFSMFVYPWVGGWNNVQNVWHRWQGLNVGILALFSSVIFFEATRYKDLKEKERNFFAAKSFLPEALSELCKYLEDSSKDLKKAWQGNQDEGVSYNKPKLPENYKEIFKECIKYSEPNVGVYLAKILSKLQIYSSRMNALYKNEHPAIPTKYNLLDYFYNAGEIRALVNKIFDFSRDDGGFDCSNLKWADFRAAYFNLNIYIENFYLNDSNSLEKRTLFALDKGN